MTVEQAEYRRRREQVLAAIHPGALLLFSAPVKLRNNDVEYEYRQDSDFYYLTGFEEPESVLLLSTLKEHKFYLFTRARDREREVWDGYRAGPEGAVSDFGADVAFPISELSSKLPELLENTERLFFMFGRHSEVDAQVFEAVQRVKRRARFGVSWPTELVDAANIMHEMRVEKSSAELDLVRMSVDISVRAHELAMHACRPGMWEYELEAVLFSEFRKRGAARVAYPSIVGSGPNATVLHYRQNNRKMLDGELVLIDAGAEYGYYASDITRTFPVNGHFNQHQRELYELTLEAQLAAIEAVKPGTTLDAVHKRAVEVVCRGLVELGLIEGPVEEALEQERYKRYFMHKTSHFLGMDVHDVGRYFINAQHRPLVPNMLITVEPGIYVAPDDETAPPSYRGIGIRIEDDVLVTEAGSVVMSGALPKSVAEIERACER